MGITIHYAGKARSREAIDELIAEFKEIAIVSGWEYHLIDQAVKGEFQPSWGHGYGYIPSPEEIAKDGIEFFPAMVARRSTGYYKIWESKYAEQVRTALREGELPKFYIDTCKKGIQLDLHPKCELLEFIFDLQTLELASYETYDHTPRVIFGYNSLFCKTQYAGVKIHILVCKLLKQAERYIEFTKINDEANYFLTQDLNIAVKAFNQSTAMLETLGKMLKEMGQQYGFAVKTGDEM